QGAEVNASFNGARNALTVAAERGNLGLVELLIAKGANIDPTNTTTALFDAAASGRTEVVALLLKKGALFDVQDEEGWTPLLKAAANGYPDVVEALCKVGADPSKRNTFGRAALDYARGIPGTQALTSQEFTTAVERGVFKHEETYYVLKRK